MQMFDNVISNLKQPRLMNFIFTNPARALRFQFGNFKEWTIGLFFELLASGRGLFAKYTNAYHIRETQPRYDTSFTSTASSPF